MRPLTGCYRDPSWPWYRQPFPWWTLFFLVPIYATCSSLANLQRVRSIQLPVMVFFACAAYATTKAVTLYVSDHLSVTSAFGAVVIGLCGNIWSRLGGGTAFTSMITGVLFLVPVSASTFSKKACERAHPLDSQRSAMAAGSSPTTGPPQSNTPTRSSSGCA